MRWVSKSNNLPPISLSGHSEGCGSFGGSDFASAYKTFIKFGFPRFASSFFNALTAGVNTSV